MSFWKCVTPAFAVVALAACTSPSPVDHHGEGGAGGTPAITFSTATATATSSSSDASSSSGLPPNPPLCSDSADPMLSPGTLDPSATYHTITGPNNQEFVVVAVDGQNNTILAGGTIDVTDFGAGPVLAVNPFADGSDLFVAKYDPTGTLLWVRRFWASEVLVNGIAVDSHDNIALMGSYINGKIDFGSTVLAKPATDDAKELFVAELGPDGAFRWARTIGGPGFDLPGKVTIAPGDDVVVAGESGKQQLSLSRFSADGAVLFQTLSGHLSGKLSLFAPIDVVLADSHGDLFITGVPGALLGEDPAAEVHAGSVYLAKYSGLTGSLLWVKHFPGIGFDETNGDQTMVLVGDDVVLAGLTNGPIDLGNGLLSEACPGITALYLARLAGADGGVIWSRGVRAEGALFPHVFVDPQGHLALTALLGPPSDPGGGVFANLGAFAMTYDATTGAYQKARELLEVEGMFLVVGNRSEQVLDATGHLVTATSFFDPSSYGLGTITSTGWGDVMIVRAPL